LHQNENGRRRETTIVAGATRLVATLQRSHHPPRHADVALTPSLHDPASVAYLIRSLPADLAGTTSYQVLEGTKIYTITVTPAGTERIDVADRTWQARHLRLTLQLVPTVDLEPTSAPESARPELAPPGASADVTRADTRNHAREAQPPVQEADLWLSAGPERLPLRMRAETFWGWVSVELMERLGTPKK
jgi:hypothetical protein